MNDWNIQSRSHHCQLCQKPFADKDVYHTLLFDQKQEFTRQDICRNCWSAQYREGVDRKGFVSHWQGTYLAPEVAPDPIQKETAETLLRKLVEANDPKHAAACYILAVMLERKRVFKVKEQLRRDQNRIFIYEHPPTGDIFSITDPALQLTQLDNVQREVAALLEHGFPIPPADPGNSVGAAMAPGVASPADSESTG